ncbi:MAG: ATP synthase subunit delta [Parcubacteria group bacterium GW2011_GWE2_39_37]|uniref:ATP synthase subunit delta n=1 Tax=Candidatus Falkowbacteria bacterium GW2011_GWF2_39_8 TaxID=1618642 RepID=A0A0G0SE15_9BACT|nr:MAG: ATP synthase subunit delta [Parcubacteria group bacterium GW2011_GWE2_39_37]KKR32955.1 MAG: ATP synthase subunit delta [Candidatus Falkowbacteria bacterium GW2011_GWF2_39_8]
MKITNRQYAVSLHETVKDAKNNDQVKEVIKNFITLLVKNNNLNKVNGILEEFNKVWSEQTGIINASVLSATKLDKETLEDLEKFAMNVSGAKEVIIDNQIDKQVLAGFVLKVGDQILDGSLKTKIKELKTEISK